MTAPYVVAAWPELDWASIDDAIWVTRALRELPVGPVGDQPRACLVAHNDPATGTQCKHSPAGISLHEIVSTEPLTIAPSLACTACSWHGFVRDGKWVPA